MGNGTYGTNPDKAETVWDLDKTRLVWGTDNLEQIRIQI